MQQSKLGLKKDNNNTNFYKNVCVFQHQHEEPMNSNLGTGLGNGQGLQNEQCSLLLGQKLVSFEGALNLDQTERPRDFIDAWSTAERNSIEDISNKCSGPSNGKMPLSSLTLSMSGGNENNEENENAQMGLGIVDSERENGGGGAKSQPMLNWMSPGSWMGSTPGGPLAEALCLGIASTAKGGGSNEAASPHGHTSSSSTTSSSSSKSSSGDSSSQGLNLTK
ncbi:hypothetical protein L1049_021848 [Liquidambar formosana]|uniref:Growth-regulating factor n=1 Tax=Liquidambar formosana TaxID=63359 RepID=A0AAP0WNG3_LIQFO